MAKAEHSDEWADFARELGMRLQRARVSAAMTQEDVAYRADIARSHYQQLEKGQSRPGVAANPSLLTLVSLAEALGVGVGDLIPDPPASGVALRAASGPR